jgi:hypothetical protein
MTIAHVEKFAELVGQNPDLYAKFGWEKMAEVGVKDMPAKVEWMASAVNEGKAHGLIFTAEEALEFLTKSFTDAASGELSDLQLEAVAGGKGAAAQTVLNAISPSAVNSAANSASNSAVNWTNNAVATVNNKVATVFSGW